MKKTIVISIYLLALFLCYSCKEKEPSVIDRLAGDNQKYWYSTLEYPSNIPDDIYISMENILAFTYINRSSNSSLYFRDGVCYESWMQKADWGETYQLINDSTIEFNNYRSYRINYLTDNMMLLSSIYPGNDLRYILYLHVPDELVTIKSFCDSKNLPSLDSIQPLEIKKRLTNNSGKYWYLAKVFPSEGRAYVADTAYYRGTFSFTYLDEKGNYEKYYRDNLCSPIFKYQPPENYRSGWEMLNDSTIRIGDSQDLHIQYLTNEMMILSFFSKKDDTDYYYLYLKAPDEMITAKNICDL